MTSGMLVNIDRTIGEDMLVKATQNSVKKKGSCFMTSSRERVARMGIDPIKEERRLREKMR